MLLASAKALAFSSNKELAHRNLDISPSQKISFLDRSPSRALEKTLAAKVALGYAPVDLDTSEVCSVHKNEPIIA